MGETEVPLLVRELAIAWDIEARHLRAALYMPAMVSTRHDGMWSSDTDFDGAKFFAMVA